jgi:LPS sulfotransferase NodH
MKQEKQNFIIFGHGRSGSNLLRSLLNSHPEIDCIDEPFNPIVLKNKKKWIRLLIVNFPVLYVRLLSTKYPDKYFGFKLFSWHLKNANSIPEKLEKLGWKVIYISRKNILKQAFSKLIGKQNKLYVRTNELISIDEVFDIPVKDVVNQIKRIQKLLIQESEALENVNHLHIIYEDDLKNMDQWDTTSTKVFHKLGLEPVKTVSKTFVTDSRTDKERIANFDEIIDHLNKNGFSEQVKEYYEYL